MNGNLPFRAILVGLLLAGSAGYVHGFERVAGLVGAVCWLIICVAETVEWVRAKYQRDKPYGLKP